MSRLAQARLVLVCVPCSMWLAEMPLPYPFAQWVTVVPAACMGLVLHEFGARSRRAHFFGWLSVAVSAVLVLTGWETVAVQYTIGISGALLALTFRTKATSLSRIASEMSFGLYLLHPLIFALVLHLPFDDFGLQAGVVVFASIALTRVIQRVTPSLV